MGQMVGVAGYKGWIGAWCQFVQRTQVFQLAPFWRQRADLEHIELEFLQGLSLDGWMDAVMKTPAGAGVVLWSGSGGGELAVGADFFLSPLQPFGAVECFEGFEFAGEGIAQGLCHRHLVAVRAA